MGKEKGFAEGMMRSRKSQAESFLSIPENEIKEPAEVVKKANVPASDTGRVVKAEARPRPEANFSVNRVKEDLPVRAEEGYYNVLGVVDNKVERKTKHVCFIMRPSTYELLHKRASLQGISANELIHVIIEKYCVD